MNGKVTEHGFQFGSALVECLCSDDKKGWVVVSIKTPKTRIQVYVTKTGKVRVHEGAVELKKVEKQ